MTGFVILVLLGAALLLLIGATAISATRRRALPPMPLLGALGAVAVAYVVLHIAL
jgi:hypothetical protein